MSSPADETRVDLPSGHSAATPVFSGIVSPNSSSSTMTPDDTTSSDQVISLERQDSVDVRKQCWVCFLTDEDTEDLAKETSSKTISLQDNWVKPCKCKGSAKWVHQSCLQKWIDEKQKSNPSVGVSCSQCKTEYILVFPKSGTLVYIIETYDRFLFGTSPFGAATIAIGTVYWGAVSFGALTVLQVFGHEEGKAIMEEADPLMLLIGLPAIPFLLLIGKLFRWEDQVLLLWKNHYKRVPWLGYVIGEPEEEARESAAKVLIGRESYSDPIASTRLFCGALILPTISTIVGKFCFPSVESQFKRTVMGGMLFILGKGLLRICLRQQQYIRQSKRQVVNYNDIIKPVDKSTSTQDD